jgi:hypothetical protein
MVQIRFLLIGCALAAGGMAEYCRQQADSSLLNDAELVLTRGGAGGGCNWYSTIVGCTSTPQCREASPPDCSADCSTACSANGTYTAVTQGTTESIDSTTTRDCGMTLDPSMSAVSCTQPNVGIPLCYCTGFAVYTNQPCQKSDNSVTHC